MSTLQTPAPSPEPGGPGVSKREVTKAANRAAILDAARVVFADLGYGAASVRDIVRGTDLATGTFYNYFPDKESVLRALLADTASEVRGRLVEVRGEAGDLESFVADGFRVYFSFLLEDRSTFELMRRNAGTIRSMFDEPMLVGGLHELMGDIQAGIERGALPPMDVEFTAAAMFGAGFEVGMVMLEQDPPDVERATALMTALFAGAARASARPG